MSRAEIAAAAHALRTDARRQVRSALLGAPRCSMTVPAALLSDYAAQVRAEPTYRVPLVLRLQNRIDTGTYVARADDIAEQLLGRLVAAELAA